MEVGFCCWQLVTSSFTFFREENRPLGVVGLKGFAERAILAAMKEWENKSCIRFVERTNENDYV